MQAARVFNRHKLERIAASSQERKVSSKAVLRFVSEKQTSPIEKQEVLERTNSILPFDTKWMPPASYHRCCAISYQRK
jgi:hypothetical protein